MPPTPRRAATALMLLPLVVAGCDPPSRSARYPEGALQVRYEASTTYTGCLTACVAMAANYLSDKNLYTETSLRRDLQLAGLDETRISDVKTYLASRGLHLVTLAGQLRGDPPASLTYWVNQRGYPVICIINRQPDNPAHHHAVLVIGISTAGPIESADRIHYLDPSSPRPLHSEDAATFEAHWGRGRHAMMVVVRPPTG